MNTAATTDRPPVLLFCLLGLAAIIIAGFVIELLIGMVVSLMDKRAEAELVDVEKQTLRSSPRVKQVSVPARALQTDSEHRRLKIPCSAFETMPTTYEPIRTGLVGSMPAYSFDIYASEDVKGKATYWSCAEARAQRAYDRNATARLVAEDMQLSEDKGSYVAHWTPETSLDDEKPVEAAVHAEDVTSVLESAEKAEEAGAAEYVEEAGATEKVDGGAVDEAAEDTVEDAVEGAVEDTVEEAVEDTVEEAGAAECAEDVAEGAVEKAVEIENVKGDENDGTIPAFVNVRPSSAGELAWEEVLANNFGLNDAVASSDPSHNLGSTTASSPAATSDRTVLEVVLESQPRVLPSSRSEIEMRRKAMLYISAPSFAAYEPVARPHSGYKKGVLTASRADNRRHGTVSSKGRNAMSRIVHGRKANKENRFDASNMV